MAQTLYLDMGETALTVLEAKLQTGSDQLSTDERSYVGEVRDWLRSLLDEQARLEKLVHSQIAKESYLSITAPMDNARRKSSTLSGIAAATS